MIKSKSELTTTPSKAIATSPYSLTSLANFINDNFTIIFLAGLFFLAGFFSGSLFTENQILKKGSANVAAAPVGTSETMPVAPTGPTAETLKNAKAISDADHVKGNKNAKVTLIEYSDFECAFCARFHPTAKQLVAEYGDQIAFVYRHYPLSFHPQAQKAAEASECVVKVTGRPDAFWEFADKIFEENNKLGGRLDATSATTVATSMGVDVAAFKTCLDSGEMSAKVKAQMDDGTAAGITGTPGTIILTQDGQAELIPGAVPFEQAKAAVDKYL